MGRSSIKKRADWMTDLVLLGRLDNLVQYTQRTVFVKAIMNLPSKEGVVATAIRRSCERQGIDCRPPRGKPASSIDVRDLSTEKRYAASVLIKALYNTDDAGLDAGDDGCLVDADLLDRMLFVYSRYLSQSKLTAADAPLSFEHFAIIRQQFVLADLELVACTNCGCEYISGRSGHGVKCPICISHRHALRSSAETPMRHLGAPSLRRTA